MSLLRDLLGDAEIARLLGPQARIGAMLRVESALARAQAEQGLIPADAAARIGQVLSELRPGEGPLAPDALAAGAARAGIAAQAVVAALRTACGPDGDWLHHGATSQDIEDSALILQLREVLDLLESRLRQLGRTLAAQARAHAELVVPARTRFQIAQPTTLGARIARWAAPLDRDLARLAELRPRLLCLALHGAAGGSAALGPDPSRLRRAVAARLDLHAPEIPWHSSRDAICELGGWLALVSGNLGKMGVDLVLLAQSGIGELHAGEGGGSSTMPQKANPVMAEALVTLARLNAADLGGLHQAMLHALERDGAALAIEWEILPGMAERTGAALRLASALAGGLRPDRARIAASIAEDRGRMMAEAAVFRLAPELGRRAAEDVVAQALRRVAEDPHMTLALALAELRPGPDWESILAPERNLGAAVEIARGVAPRQDTSHREDT